MSDDKANRAWVPVVESYEEMLTALHGCVEFLRGITLEGQSDYAIKRQREVLDAALDAIRKAEAAPGS